MLQLSNEVLLMILELLCSVKDLKTYGEKQDLLACRGTCRRLANVGQGLAFAHISFAQGAEGYERLLKISKSPSLCDNNRHLTCYTARGFFIRVTKPINPILVKVAFCPYITKS
ncbi:hypothetical protein V8E51_003927 [Hyaloscypha variabilis]|jgi:hypothetical protein